MSEIDEGKERRIPKPTAGPATATAEMYQRNAEVGWDRSFTVSRRPIAVSSEANRASRNRLPRYRNLSRNRQLPLVPILPRASSSPATQLNQRFSRISMRVDLHFEVDPLVDGALSAHAEQYLKQSASRLLGAKVTCSGSDPSLEGTYAAIATGVCFDVLTSDESDMNLMS